MYNQLMTRGRYLSCRDVADTLGYSLDHVRRLFTSGAIPNAVRLGGMGDWRLAEQDLEAYLEASRRLTHGDAA
jgi:excisionase family DNA binding protein